MQAKTIVSIPIARIFHKPTTWFYINGCYVCSYNHIVQLWKLTLCILASKKETVNIIDIRAIRIARHTVLVRVHKLVFSGFKTTFAICFLTGLPVQFQWNKSKLLMLGPVCRVVTPGIDAFKQFSP